MKILFEAKILILLIGILTFTLVYQNCGEFRVKDSVINASSGCDIQSLTFEKDVKGLLENHCLSCHTGNEPKGFVSFDGMVTQDGFLSSHFLWDRAVFAMESGRMPTSGAVPNCEVERAKAWVHQVTHQACGGTEPGSVLIHRLNKDEYNYTICDLTGVCNNPGKNLPAGNWASGFDNNAMAMTLSDDLLNEFLLAAENTVDQVMDDSGLKNQIVQCAGLTNNDCLTKMTTEFGMKAFRRPLTQEEITHFQKLYNVSGQNNGLNSATERILTAVLMSPQFLFRSVKSHLSPSNLDDFELASRLSYFLWSSMPDQELLEKAKAGTLKDPQTLKTQVKRMVQSPKISRFVDRFGEQWLQLSDLKNQDLIDPENFDGFDQSLKGDMLTETKLLLDEIIKKDSSLLEMFTADYTYLNERLANIYGIAGVTGTDFQRVSLAGNSRMGVLTQASFLAVTTPGGDTSPIKRARFILENVLCTPPGAPPQNVESSLPESIGGVTLREKLEAHRTNPACYSCHVSLDPIGFGFENYDSLGRYRETLDDQPIDATGNLPDGQFFNGALGFIRIVQNDEKLKNCVVKKVFGYALGRLMTSKDQCSVQSVAGEGSNFNFTELVLKLSTSTPFSMSKDSP